MSIHKIFLMLLLLIEGASLMAVEILSAKFLSPFYGTSLYVWTAVLSITILGLTFGYFTGGRIASKYVSLKNISFLMGISGLLVYLMSFTSTFSIALTHSLLLIPGVVISSILLIVPPVFCFGLVGPMAVNLMTNKLDEIGTSAGLVYFTSTIGGIFSAFLFGYYFIPFSGLKFSSHFVAVLLISLPIFYFIFSFFGINESQKNSIEENKISIKSRIKSEAIPASIILFAIIEGASVMAVELFAARMLAPYFGSSLFVWSAVIGVTLLGLAIGYLLGGRVADIYPEKNTLYWVILLAALFTLCMHFVCTWLTFSLTSIEIQSALIIVALLLMLPPLIFFGMIPTLLIRLLSSAADDSGRVAGKVFSISSASGILALPLLGFFIIPYFGLTGPSITLGILVGFFPFIKLVAQKKYYAFTFLVVAFFSFNIRATAFSSPDVEVLEYSEGLLGQMLVADMHKTAEGKEVNNRMLLVNRMGQTQLNRTTGNTDFLYITFSNSLASVLPKGDNALVLGLGGGMAANNFQHLGLHVDAVELDDRIANAAQDYFMLDPSVNIISDDARHYLQTSSKKYDLIYFDIFRCDYQPPHVLSEECFKKAKELLSRDGFLIINFNGFLNGKLGIGGRSIYKTLTASGFQVKWLLTPGEEAERNSLFIASSKEISFSQLRSPLLHNGQVVDMDSLFIANKEVKLNDAEILTDDRPVIERLNMAANNSWRQGYNKEVNVFFNQIGLSLFK